ncbi:MAG: hypothetical protein GC159_24235 [Phycisphaera sp.]|nr:hypothetical protein [Phycisphaera sp.]
MTTRLVAGCMTGTSLDGIDAALIRVEGRGLNIRVEAVRGVSRSLKSLAKLLRPIADQRRRPIGDVARYAMMLGQHHAMTLSQLSEKDRVDFVAVHGQTVYHEGGVSMQLINPHPIAAELGVPVAYDFRGADLALGGSGAPITPLADHVLYRDAGETRVVVNLGGFANYTWLPATKQTGDAALASIRGGDICACNQLLDYIARRWFKKRYDRDGAHAHNGIVHPEAEADLRMMLETQAREGRSLGTGDEMTAWAAMFQHNCNGDDLAATACHVIGSIIAETVTGADRVILAGGGAMNATLVDAIRSASDAAVTRSDDLGVNGQYREAIAMAVLAALADDGVAVTLPQVTGRRPDAKPMPAWIRP